MRLPIDFSSETVAAWVESVTGFIAKQALAGRCTPKKNLIFNQFTLTVAVELKSIKTAKTNIGITEEYIS